MIFVNDWINCHDVHPRCVAKVNNMHVYISIYNVLVDAQNLKSGPSFELQNEFVVFTELNSQFNTSNITSTEAQNKKAIILHMSHKDAWRYGDSSIGWHSI